METALARAKRLSPAIPAPAAPETGGTLTVDLAAIEANWRALAHRLLTVECAAVVKANAYGLGLSQVTTRLVQAGCKTFFVADLAEARTVRSRASEATIYVLDGFTPDWGDGFIEINEETVVGVALMKLEKPVGWQSDWFEFRPARRYPRYLPA